MMQHWQSIARSLDGTIRLNCTDNHLVGVKGQTKSQLTAVAGPDAGQVPSQASFAQYGHVIAGSGFNLN